MSNAFGPRKPLFGPYTYRAKQNSNGDTLIGVYFGSKRVAHMDAYWAYSMRAIEEREEELELGDNCIIVPQKLPGEPAHEPPSAEAKKPAKRKRRK